MAVAIAPAPARLGPPSPGCLFWSAALAVTLAFAYLPQLQVPRWALKLPREWQIPLARHVSALMDWLVTQASLGFVTFKELTRGLAWLLDRPLDVASALLVHGLVLGQGAEAVRLAPPLPWLSVVVLAAASAPGPVAPGSRPWSAAASSIWRCSASGPAPWQPWPRSWSPYPWVPLEASCSASPATAGPGSSG